MAKVEEVEVAHDLPATAMQTARRAANALLFSLQRGALCAASERRWDARLRGLLRQKPKASDQAMWAVTVRGTEVLCRRDTQELSEDLRLCSIVLQRPDSTDVLSATANIYSWLRLPLPACCRLWLAVVLHAA